MKKSVSFFILFVFSIHSWGQEKGQKTVGKDSPNIIFILTDDLGYGDLGVIFQNQRAETGEPHHSTPNLDQLVAEGMLLRRHYAPAPVCAPSRASLMLGVHQGHANVRDNQFDKALPDTYTLSSVLQTAGYATALIGKWGLQGLSGNSPETWKAYPTKRGFDYFLGYVRHSDGHNHYPAHEAHARKPSELYQGNDEISAKLKGVYTTDLFTAAAKKWITEKQKSNPSQPFFLELAYDTPHAGLQIAASPYPEGGGLHGGVQWIGEAGNFINTADESIDDYFYPDYANKDWPESQKRFASMVRRIDTAIGDIMQLLKDLGIDKETLVVFTSDNGPHTESYGYGPFAPTFFDSYGPLDGIKRDTWEGGIRMPTVVRWPHHIAKGEINNTPSAFYDWMPTFTALAGIPAPARTDGVSLLPLLTGEGTQNTGVVYVEYQQGGRTPKYAEFDASHQGEFRGEMQVIYVDGYKGVRYNIKSAGDDFRMYDTAKDPGEVHNLAGSSAYFEALQQRMEDRVLQIRRPNTSAPRPYDSVPVPAIKYLDAIKSGLQYRVFEVSTPWTPAIETLQERAVDAGISEDFDLEVATRKDNIVIEYKGLLKVPETGEYSFTLKTDRGAIVRIHEARVLDAGKEYQSGTAISSSIFLEKGVHPIQLIYARAEKGTPLLKLTWSGPGFSKKPVEREMFFHTK